MKLHKELLEKVCTFGKVCSFRNDEILVLHTKNDKVLLSKLVDLLNEMGFVWISGDELKMYIDGNMQYIYITRGKVAWGDDLEEYEGSVFFNYNEVKEFLEEDEKSAEDNPLLDYALSLLNVSKEELIKMKKENDNKTKVEKRVKKMLNAFECLGYLYENECISCDDCPYRNSDFSCKQTIILCHLMEEGKLIL